MEFKLTFLLFIVILASKNVLSWISDTPAILRLDSIDADGIFQGNQTYTDHFKILERDGDSLLVGARNVVYNISLSDLQENNRIVWNSLDIDVSMCTMKGKSEGKCHNYIRVLVKEASDRVLICGTNAYKPLCRYYQHNDETLSYDTIEQFPGEARCPFDPNDNSTAIIVDGQLYTATVADFSSRDPLIYRAPLRTQQYDVQWLNEPNFVSSFSFGSHIYFLFRETSVEYVNCGKVIYSRVGRVCKSDEGGGSYILNNIWTSFFKSRLNCSIPGDFPFYFDEIQDSSGLLEYGQYSGEGSGNPYFYSVFTTPENSIAGSAICIYSMQQIEGIFNGRFKAQKDGQSNWLPVSTLETPSNPRPGQCVNDSRKDYPSETLRFIKDHRLMDQPVNGIGGRPVVVYTNPSNVGSRFTRVAVHPSVRAVDGRYYDVIFIGTNDGKVMKAVNNGSGDSVDSVMIEELKVFPQGFPVTNLHVYSDSVSGSEKLVVVSSEEIRSLPLERCGTRLTCGDCVGLQDPYCAWDALEERCVHDTERKWSDNIIQHTERYLQNVETGSHWRCKESHQDVVPQVDDISAHPDYNNNEVSPTGRFSPSHLTDYNNMEVSDINKLPAALPLHPNPRIEGEARVFSAETLALAIILTIILSLGIGVCIGYAVSVRYQHTKPAHRLASLLPWRRSSSTHSTSPSHHPGHPLPQTDIYPGYLHPEPANNALHLVNNLKPQPPPLLTSPTHVNTNINECNKMGNLSPDMKTNSKSGKVYI